MNNEFKLRNGTILLSTEAPGGIYNAAQLRKIASLCEGDVAIVKATEDQRLALCVNPEQAQSIAQELQSIGLGIRHYQDGLHHPTSCIGELCPDHEQDALGTALDISQQLESLKLTSPLKIGINGCAKCCVPCHTLDISVVGDSSGYRVSLGGKNSQIPEMASFIAEAVPANELPALLKKVIETYSSKAEAGESLQDLIERVGAQDFITAFAPYSQDAAAGSDDPFGAPQDDLDSSVNEEIAESEAIASDDPDMEISPLQNSDELSMDSDIQIASDDIALENDVSLLPADDTMIASEIGDDVAGMADISQSHDALDEAALDSDLKMDADLAEAKIDVSDVLTGKQNSSTEVVAEESVSQPASEDLPIDEDLVEKELSASISEQGDLHLESETDENRDSALNVLETSDADLESLDVNAQAEQMPDDIADVVADVAGSVSEDSDLEIESIDANEISSMDDISEETISVTTDEMHGVESLEVEAIEDEAAGAGEDNIEEIDVSDEPMLVGSEDDFDVEDLPLSERVAVLPSSAIHDSGTEEGKIAPVRPLIAHQKSGWTFSGLDIDASGCPVVTFGNGVRLTITAEAISAGELRIGGHKVKVAEADGGIEVMLDGMRLFVPKAA